MQFLRDRYGLAVPLGTQFGILRIAGTGVHMAVADYVKGWHPMSIQRLNITAQLADPLLEMPPCMTPFSA